MKTSSSRRSATGVRVSIFCLVTVCEAQLCNTAHILTPVWLHLLAILTPSLPSSDCLPHPPAPTSFNPSLNTACLLTSCSDFSRKPIILPHSYPFFMTQFKYQQLCEIFPVSLSPTRAFLNFLLYSPTAFLPSFPLSSLSLPSSFLLPSPLNHKTLREACGNVACEMGRREVGEESQEELLVLCPMTAWTYSPELSLFNNFR